MTDKHKKPPTKAEVKAKRLSRWENEGGAKTDTSNATGKNPKRPRDPNQLAKLMVDIATGEEEDIQETPTEKRASNAGKIGGPARAKKLSTERRHQIAKKAAKTRWEEKSVDADQALLDTDHDG